MQTEQVQTKKKKQIEKDLTNWNKANVRVFQKNMKINIIEMQHYFVLTISKELDLSPCSCTGERFSSTATGTDFVLNGVDCKSSRRLEENNTVLVK